MAQYIIISIILGIVVFYIGLRLYNTFTQKSTPCDGCTGCCGNEESNKTSCGHS